MARRTTSALSTLRFTSEPKLRGNEAGRRLWNEQERRGNRRGRAATKRSPGGGEGHGRRGREHAGQHPAERLTVGHGQTAAKGHGERPEQEPRNGDRRDQKPSPRRHTCESIAHGDAPGNRLQILVA